MHISPYKWWEHIFCNKESYVHLSLIRYVHTFDYLKVITNTWVKEFSQELHGQLENARLASGT